MHCTKGICIFRHKRFYERIDSPFTQLSCAVAISANCHVTFLANVSACLSESALLHAYVNINVTLT